MSVIETAKLSLVSWPKPFKLPKEVYWFEAEIKYTLQNKNTIHKKKKNRTELFPAVSIATDCELKD